MASIVLSNVGGAIGASTDNPFLAYVGARVGQIAGTYIDNALFSSTSAQHTPRLASLAVQTSAYGKMIPIIYGTVRLGGNIIWSQPIQQTASTSSSGGGKGGGGGSSQQTTTYSYSITLAIAICEGPVDNVLRIWADAEQLDLSQYTVRIYTGDEDQLPDSLIQSIEGIDATPAYRGLAYVVFENFPMADFGNRIPNFSFEVQRKCAYPDYNNLTVEDMITGMVMIPGGGEFVYDTVVEYKVPGVDISGSWVQQGDQVDINMQNTEGEANALLSLTQLQATCPNVEWVSVVVAWFGDNMDAGSCTIMPGVEFQTGAITTPDTWGVGGFTRDTARQITLVDGSPQYGGTPDDTSILNYIAGLKTSGYKIMFYPMMFMDVSGKPWRGEMTGSSTDVGNFFTKTNGYNAFITHYASMVAGKVDGFIIGSELRGMTAVTDTPGNYPAVNQLVSLAASVKSTLGSGVTVTYAADWSEYHHTTGGWYNLDPLWASSNIDVIGIDAYFPLTNSPTSVYDIPTLMAGWTSGEGYDWYYSDMARTIQVSLTPPFAWKDLAWFWNNTHTNPDSTTTAWTPSAKPIWFTEVGYPSVDCCSNEPNVFYDPSSSSSAFPYYSKGQVDFGAQRAALAATHQQWSGSSMVTQMFVWTWDARPFPYWPDLTDVWTDGASWQTGHWVEGKLGISSLAAVVSQVAERVGLEPSDIDVSQITDLLSGYVLTDQTTARSAIETLQKAYFFDVAESDDVLYFIPRGGSPIASVPEDDLVPATSSGKNSGQLFQITRTQEIELPMRVNVVYMSSLLNYQPAIQYSQRAVTSSLEITTIDFPIVMDDQIAKNIADSTLYSTWTGRNSYQFDLPISYACLDPSDVITVTVCDVEYRMRIASIRCATPGVLRVQAIADDVTTYNFYGTPAITSGLLALNQTVPDTDLGILDIPALPTDDPNSGALRFAGVGLSSSTWPGAAVYRSDDGGASYASIADLPSASVMGSAITTLAYGPATIFDLENTVTVSLMGSGELQSVTQLAVLNGANVAMLGDEMIQFTTATLVTPGQYTLGGLLRGRLGTEWAINTHTAGEGFILLDGTPAKLVMANTLIGQPRLYKGVTYGKSISDATSESFTYEAIGLMPYSPAHIIGVRDGSGDLTINWFRRTRLGGPWLDGADVPLNEATEAYEVDILNGSTVVRTLTGLSSPIASYSATQQTTDFGSAQSSIAVNVYQLSAAVGRGYPGGASI